MDLKKAVKAALLRRGYQVRHYLPAELGRDPFRDMNQLCGSIADACIFDIGANAGQSIASFRQHFASPVIHAFEPSSATFATLKKNTVGTPGLHLNNLGMGTEPGEMTFYENQQSLLGSVRPPGPFQAAGALTGQTRVQIDTVDAYCERSGITRIDVLKCDAEGFDLEVLRGAQAMFRAHRVRLVYVELIFEEAYAGMHLFEETFLYLKSLGVAPLHFYNQWHHESLTAPLHGMDGLFRDEDFGGRADS